MKSVLMSIQPKWCELIARGKKTIEVRKTCPKETPFKVYIYETSKKILVGEHFEPSKSKSNLLCGGKLDYIVKKDYYYGKGKVIGEFVCDKVDLIDGATAEIEKESCLRMSDIYRYAKGKNLYGLHISQLKIYDTPKELGEFYKYSTLTNYDFCAGCPYHETPITEFPCNECKHDAWERKYLTRPPQSWMYVEELAD